MLQKLFNIYLFTFIFSHSLYSQETTTFEIQKQKSLCQVWGYLKYYHPQVTGRKMDWDAVLIEKFNSLKAIKDGKELQLFYDNWLLELGKTKNCDFTEFTQIPHDSTTWNLEMTWGDNSKIFSNSFSNQLKCLYLNKKSMKNQYISLKKWNIVPNFIENPYMDLKYPPSSYRFLALCRGWNIINYFYPDKYALSVKWETTLETLIPAFLNAQNQLEYEIALKDLSLAIEDAHVYGGVTFQFMRRGGFFPPFHIVYLHDTLLVAELDDKTPSALNIQKGDIILEINGVTTQKYTDSLIQFIPGYDKAFENHIISGAALRSNTATIQLKILRKGTLHIINVEQLQVPLKPKHFYKDLIISTFNNDKTAYLNLGVLSKKALKKNLEEYTKTKDCLILDLRTYPIDNVGGFENYLFPKAIPYAYWSSVNLKHPGTFQFTTSRKTGKNNSNAFRGKVIVLCGGATMSYGETLCMMLKQYSNTTFIGEHTAGANGNVTEFVLPGGYIFPFSGLGAYFSNGMLMQRNGIPIDIECKPTASDVLNGCDAVLEKAIEYAKSK
jgi:carboxyl-terminal processing protease